MALVPIANIFVTVLTKDDLMASGWYWLWAFLYFFGCLLLFLLIPENVFSSKQTRWHYESDVSFLGYYKRYTSIEEVFGPQPASGPPPLPT